MRASIAILVLLSAVLAACQIVPQALQGGELIVMKVENQSAAPVALVVASPGNIADVVGSAAPAVVAPGQTVTANFLVPPVKAWAIFANGGELMGSIDVKQQRGALPMGITVDATGSQSWWCNANCP